MQRVTVLGAAGRMGRNLIQAVVNDPGTTLAGAVEMPGCPLLGRDAGEVAGCGPLDIPVTDNLADALTGADAVIDFTAASCTLANARAAVEHGCNVVIGTTGLDASHTGELRALADSGARIVLAPNMSVGVNLLFHLSQQVAATLGEKYDIEVVEMHHNQKKDAPSGTAVRLGEILAHARGYDYSTDTAHGRVGQVGARPTREIGMHALRGGDVVGEHTVIFATEGERVELTHKASSRQTFAKGAVRAVLFLSQVESGLYDMQDVLALR